MDPLIDSTDVSVDSRYVFEDVEGQEDQEAVGAWLLAEIDSERRWDELFARPSDVLERMADEALNEHAAGLTELLEPDTL